MNKELLEKITILYVEDEQSIRDSLVSAIDKLFKNIIIAKDGKEALDLYIQNKNDIDIIISDLNMPILTGIDLLISIRRLNLNVPFIITTAHTDTSNLILSIEHNVTNYLTKPLDIKKLLEKVIIACENKFSLSKISHQQEEIEKYLDAINQVAIVSKTNLSGDITFVNDIFCDISQYTRDELIGSSHNIIRHPDTPKNTFKELWKIIKSGKTWQGKIKNRAKFGTAYYVNATIIPIFDSFGKDIIEFIAIRFLTTEDELEKREFKKKVVSHIQENKKKEIEKSTHIQILENKLKRYQNVSDVEEALNNERKRASKFLTQIKHYETTIKTIEKSNEDLIDSANKKVKKASEIAINLNVNNQKLTKNLALAEDELDKMTTQLRDSMERIDEQSKVIRDLRDVVNYREGQMNGKF